MLQSTFRKKILRVGFWGLLLYIAITSTVVIAIQFQVIPVPKKSLMKEESIAKQSSFPLVSETSFAKLFAREYLSWTKGEENNRSIRLEPFWQKGMDKQGAMDFNNTKWNSFPQFIEVWKVEDRPGNKGIKEVTIYAETYLTKVDKADQQKRIDRYMVVPIKKAGDSYRVVDIPYFVAPPVASSLSVSEDNEKKDESVDLAIKSEIEEWLPSFWKTFTNDSPREISYLMKNNQPTIGLAGIMEFIELKQVEVYKNGDHYRVKNHVLLRDIASDTEVNYQYTLNLVKEENRWFILDIKQGKGL